MDAMAEKDPLATSGSLLSIATDQADSLTPQAVAAQERIKAASAGVIGLDQGAEEALIRRSRRTASAGSTTRARPQNRYA
jgi:hypothetical protein